MLHNFISASKITCMELFYSSYLVVHIFLFEIKFAFSFEPLNWIEYCRFPLKKALDGKCCNISYFFFFFSSVMGVVIV